MHNNLLILSSILFYATGALAGPQAQIPAPDYFNVKDFGAVGDGQTDDTAAFQKALDAASQAGGGVVQAPRGNYFFAGNLNVPSAVTLSGI